jgi:hypothetical protein
MKVWGVQNDHPDLDLIANGYISLGALVRRFRKGDA